MKKAKADGVCVATGKRARRDEDFAKMKPKSKSKSVSRWQGGGEKNLKRGVRYQSYALLLGFAGRRTERYHKVHYANVSRLLTSTTDLWDAHDFSDLQDLKNTKYE